jgi:hypothetical protein
MQSKVKQVLIAMLAILSMSCECPTDIKSPTIIKPTVFANVLFINAMPEQNLNTLYVLSSSKIVERLDTIIYNDSSQSLIKLKNYIPVGVMVGDKKNTLKLAKTERTAQGDTLKLLFNNVLNIKKDSNYTFIAFGAEESVQSLMIKDYIEKPQESNIYIRCINVSPDAPTIYFTISTEGYTRKFNLSSGEYSELANSPAGDYSISLTSADSTIKNSSYEKLKLAKGKINNIIFRGNFKGTSVNPRELIIVTGNYPLK